MAKVKVIKTFYRKEGEPGKEQANQYYFGAKHPKYISLPRQGTTLADYLTQADILRFVVSFVGDTYKVTFNDDTWPCEVSSVDNQDTVTFNNNNITDQMIPFLNEHSWNYDNQKTIKTETGKCVITFEKALSTGYKAELILIPIQLYAKSFQPTSSNG